MEEIKKLYAKLHQIDDENERKKLWIEIIEKNKILLNKKLSDLNSILEKKEGDLDSLRNKLTSLKEKMEHFKKIQNEKGE